MAGESPLDEVALRDWQPILHEEVDRLPEKYRAPVVLCYFEGKTHEAAARQLGWPLGTVKGRLARARERLRARLARRGLALPAGGLVAALAESASAAVPPVLLVLTHRAAISFAAGGALSSTASSAQALALAKGALRAMTTTRLVHGVVLLLAVDVALLGAALGAGVGREALLGTRAQATERGGHGGTLDPATHPNERDRPPPAAPPGGEPTKGLQLTLAATKKEYPRGESVDLILTIKNNSDKDFSYPQAKVGLFLEGFKMTGPDGKDVRPVQNPVELEWVNTLVPVRPGEAVTVKDSLRCINLPHLPGTDRYHRQNYYPMETSGTYRLRVKVGEATSNEPVIKVLPADGFGHEVKGLRARVSLAKQKYQVGEPIKVHYQVKNVSKEEQTLWHSGFWLNHLILVKDADGKEPPLTAFGQQCRRAFSPGGERSKNVPVKVAAGGEDAAYEPYDLTKLHDLSRPGRYTVQYVYEEKQGGWEGRLPSNVAAFEVVGNKEKQGDGIGEYQNKLQGRWLAVELAGNGFTVPKDAREFQVFVKDDRIVLDQASGKREFQFRLRGVERIVGEKIARVVGQEVEIDLIPLGDKEKGPTWLGRCVLSGDANGFELYFYRKDPQKRPPAASAKVDVGLWVIRCARRAVSTAVRVEGLSFVVAAPERISVPPVGGLYNIDFELRVTNVSDKPLALRTFDVIRPRLYTADGKELGMEVGRNGTPRPWSPELLAPGASWKWFQHQVLLGWTKDRATLRLAGPDGRGVAGSWSFTTLKEGKYRLAIEYSNSDPKQGDVSLWVGKATTNEVQFEIVPR
jgi:hypothetical protein